MARAIGVIPLMPPECSGTHPTRACGHPGAVTGRTVPLVDCPPSPLSHFLPLLPHRVGGLVTEPRRDFDVVIIGGGPAGATLGCLLGMNGYRSLILEKDIHPRDHVGESITPSTNPIFKQIGFLDKIEDAGFVHKPGACWTAPRAPVGKFVSLRLGEFPPPGAPHEPSANHRPTGRAVCPTLSAAGQTGPVALGDDSHAADHPVTPRLELGRSARSARAAGGA